MKIMVCGSIGYGYIQKIREFQHFLTQEGFNVIDHIFKEGMNHSNTKDFRFKRELSEKIVQHDLKFVDKTDVLVVLLNDPSYGAAIEMNEARRKGKKVLTLAESEIPTPWPIFFSDEIFTSKSGLIRRLKELENLYP